jgi:hypothetical protein
MRNIWCRHYDDCLSFACATTSKFSCAGCSNVLDEGGREAGNDFFAEFLLAVAVCTPELAQCYRYYKAVGGSKNETLFNRSIKEYRGKHFSAAPDESLEKSVS